MGKGIALARMDLVFRTMGPSPALRQKRTMSSKASSTGGDRCAILRKTTVADALAGDSSDLSPAERWPLIGIRGRKHTAVRRT